MRRIRAYAAIDISAPSGASEWTPPESLEWMPSGTHDVRTMTGDYTVTCDESDAATLDTQLQEMLKKASEGKASRPFIDFQHEGGAAAALPVRIFWQDGIRIAVEWTQAGIDALKGRVFSYFSPEFFLSETGHPSGLPEPGPIGGLVNTPAFQSIERLSASANTNQTEENAVEKTKVNRMESFIKRLREAGILPPDDQSANEDQLFAALKNMQCAGMDAAESVNDSIDEVAKAKARLTEVEGELTAIKAAQKAELEARADVDVTEAIKAGKIDETAKDAWRAMYVANPEIVRASLAGIKVATEKKKLGHDPEKLPGNGAKTEAPLGRVQASIARQIAQYQNGRN